MPRLINQQYLLRHRFLKRAWVEYQDYFATLSPNQQWDVHVYYQTRKDLSDAELILVRKLISKADPSLPNRASKAMLHLLRTIDSPSGTPRTYHRSSNKGNIQVRTVVKPELDLEALGLALLELVEDEQKSGSEEKAA